LEGTLIPFASPEKPQLSPWLAASLIKNGRHIDGKCSVNQASRTAKSKSGRRSAMQGGPFLLAFYDNLARYSREVRTLKIGIPPPSHPIE
jgi:hypothetical protein